MLPVASADFACGSPVRTCWNLNRLGSRQNAGDHWSVASLISSEPKRHTGSRGSTTSHRFGGGANVRGTVIRLAQFEALHHSLPSTAESPLMSPAGASSPGAYCPVAVQSFVAWSASGPAAGMSAGSTPAALPDTSQPIPMIGTITSTHGTASEQPSDAFCLSVQSTNLALPVPSSPVTPYVVLAGGAAGSG